MSNWRVGAAALTASVALLQAFAADAETRVGVTGAVNPSASGTPPGAGARQLTVGSDIEFRERVITTTDGQAQILFLDQSSLLIGPNSTVVIDEFVYDPATNKGNMAATLTQGSFRYIGGKLSKQGNATLNTPVATLGIRGSDITVDYDAITAKMNVITTHGLASLRTASGVLNLPGGFGTTISGSQVSTPTALTATQIATANRPFEGLPGRNAGSGKPPTNSDVAKSGLSQSIEAKGAASTEPGAGGAPGGGPLTIPFTPGNNDTPQKVLCAPPPQTAAAPTPIGRTDRTLNGFVGGISLPTILSDDTNPVLNTAPGSVTIRTVPDATGPGRVSATFLYGPAPDGENSTERRVRSIGIEFGNPAGSRPATWSSFTNDQAFEASQSADRAANKGQLNGAAFKVTAVLVSVPMTTPAGALTGTTAGPACECEFVTWGTWSAELHSTPRHAPGQCPKRALGGGRAAGYPRPALAGHCDLQRHRDRPRVG